MSKYFVQRNELGRHTIFPGVDIYTMAGEEIMLSYVEFEPHAEVKAHSHPHEQLGMLLEGELAFSVGDEDRVLKPGDNWRIPGGVTHRVIAGSSGARALDIFHPIRKDYL